jgi:hypothetical protein
MYPAGREAGSTTNKNRKTRKSWTKSLTTETNVVEAKRSSRQAAQVLILKKTQEATKIECVMICGQSTVLTASPDDKSHGQATKDDDF